MGQVEPADRVLVTGGGPVGLLIVAVLRAQGVTDVTVSEPSPIRRERAMAVGAARVVSPETLVDPPMGSPVSEPYAVAFECSGHASAAERALSQLDYAGTLVIVGTGFEPPRVNQNRMIIFELEVVGAYNYNAEGFAPAVALLDSGALPIESLLEPDDIPLTGVMDAMERLAARGDIEQGPGTTGGFVTTDAEAAFRPRINHVAISVDAALLDREGERRSWTTSPPVFGWTEGDNTGEKGNPLILYTGSLRQFLYLLPAADDFLVAPPLDHFGLEVASIEELQAILARAKEYQRKDDRVRIIDVGTMVTHGPTDDYTLTNAYIGFVLPLMIELQHIERQTRP